VAADKVMDVRSALATAAQSLAKAHVEDPGYDARRLLSHALQCQPIDLLTAPERRLTTGELSLFQSKIERRANREPLGRILGVRDFYGRPFRLNPATLEPRPDSECLIVTALALLGHRRDERLRIIDIGTGSGCLLLTLLAELPNAIGVGTDIDPEALFAAAGNARHLGLDDRVHWQQGSCLAGTAGPFDLIVSNPPYVRTGDIAGLDSEVRNWDPIQALDGGADGLGVYRAILNDISSIISNSYVVFEIGFDQTTDVSELINATLPAHVRRSMSVTHDMAGRPRCVTLSTHT
jgi:release factor glutamine methyltransferase